MLVVRDTLWLSDCKWYFNVTGGFPNRRSSRGRGRVRGCVPPTACWWFLHLFLYICIYIYSTAVSCSIAVIKWSQRGVVNENNKKKKYRELSHSILLFASAFFTFPMLFATIFPRFFFIFSRYFPFLRFNSPGELSTLVIVPLMAATCQPLISLDCSLG